MVGAGFSCMLPSTMLLGCFLARGVLSRYLPIRRVRSGHGSAVHVSPFKLEYLRKYLLTQVKSAEAYASYVAQEFVPLGLGC